MDLWLNKRLTNAMRINVPIRKDSQSPQDLVELKFKSNKSKMRLIPFLYERR